MLRAVSRQSSRQAKRRPSRRRHRLPRRRPKPDRAEFDKLVKAATDARHGRALGRRDRALRARRCKLKPDYVEGFWYQGTAYYTLDNHTQCRDAFRKVLRLAPKNGAAYAFLGLCEFGLKEYDRSLQHLLQSRILGVGDTPELGGTARYHAAILMTRAEQFEQALETLGEFAAEGNDNPRVIEAMGLATLRMPLLPTEAPPERREMVLMAGRASYMMATRNTAAAEKAFQALVARYPETPNVHYAYAVFLLAGAAGQGDRGVQARARAAARARLVADADRLRVREPRRRADGAAVGEAAPSPRRRTRSPRARRSARRCSTPATSRARSASCELGIKLAPESPGLHFTLARAYQRAGTPGRRGARARGVHEARSAGAHAAERRAVCGGKMTACECRSASPCLLAMVVHGGASGTSNSRRRHDAGTVSRGRPRGARRRGRPRPQGPAGPRLGAGRLRDPRGRRAAEARVVHAVLRERAGSSWPRRLPAGRPHGAQPAQHRRTQPARPTTDLIVTALVFDRLSPEAQRLAVQAAQGYLGNKEETPIYIGIFGVDLALTPYAPFTRNASMLRQALTKMCGRAAARRLRQPERHQPRASAGSAPRPRRRKTAASAAAGRRARRRRGHGTAPALRRSSRRWSRR